MPVMLHCTFCCLHDSLILDLMGVWGSVNECPCRLEVAVSRCTERNGKVTVSLSTSAMACWPPTVDCICRHILLGLIYHCSPIASMPMLERFVHASSERKLAMLVAAFLGFQPISWT